MYRFRVVALNLDKIALQMNLYRTNIYYTGYKYSRELSLSSTTSLNGSYQGIIRFDMLITTGIDILSL